jgi:molybdate transport system ATP-binding protein
MTRLDVDIDFRHRGGGGIQCAWRDDLDGGCVTAWLGASGSGKTTLLRCLAGLETPQRGHVRVDDAVWFDAARGINVPTEARNLGVLFQDYALFPHMTVEQNVAFAATPGDAAGGRVKSLLATFRLTGLERRYPRELSGGQQQRVALARAVCRRPSLLLLDEPLSALDTPTREDLRHDLGGLIREFGIPACIVTHDRVDALTLADRTMLIDEGRVVQSGPTREVFAAPLTPAAARLVGVDTVLVGSVASVTDGLARVRVGGQDVCAEAPPGFPPEVVLLIRAEDVTIARHPLSELSATNQWRAVIGAEQPEGPFVRVTLDCGFRLAALVTRDTWHRLALGRGDAVWAVVKAVAIRTLARR